MADVYLVSSERPGGFRKLQVLKLMRSDLTEQELPEFLQMFEDEARLAARLNHPNIVQSFEVGAEEGQPYIVMEFLEGQSLYRVQQRARHLRRGFPTEMELFVLCQVLEGLEYAHQVTDYAGQPLHIVHRDVSPQNVLISYTGQIKLLDFGVAKTLESSKTRAGVVKGKVAYMPPEQVASGPIDRRADLFSVGVLLWEAVAGQAMHAELTVYESMSRLLRGELPRLRDAAPNVHPELDRIVQRALQVDPARRYQDAESFRADLVAYLDSTSKVRARDVGHAVSELFARERGEMSQIIRQAMTSTGPANDINVANFRVITRRIPLQEAMTTDPTEPAPATPRSVEPPPPESHQVLRAPKPSRLRAWSATSLSVLVVGAGITFFALRSNGTDSSDVRASTAPPTPTEAPPPANDAPAAPSEIQVAIDVDPAFATITLDGRVLGQSPARSRERRDQRAHELTVQAPGYTTLQRTISFDTDVALRLQLEKARDDEAAAKPEPETPVRPTRPSGKAKAARLGNSEPYIDLPPPQRKPAPTFEKVDPWANESKP